MRYINTSLVKDTPIMLYNSNHSLTKVYSDIYRDILYGEDEKLISRDANGIYSFIFTYLEENLRYITHISTSTGIYINVLSLVQNLSFAGQDKFLNFLDELGISPKDFDVHINPTIYIKLNLNNTTLGRSLVLSYFRLRNCEPITLEFLPGSFYNELVI